MPATTLRHRHVGIRYQATLPGMTESDRVIAYRARRHVVRLVQKLIAAGRIDEAVSFCQPIIALMDTPPTLPGLDDVLERLTLEDAKEDVARALFRKDPVANRGSYLAHCKATLRLLAETVRKIEAED
jgi:hypothetical protein